MKIFNGVYTALITPFQKDLSLDLDGLKENIHFQMNQGIKGLTALGSTGETPTLNSLEKELVIKTVRNCISNDTHLMVGTGSYSTKDTIESTLKAANFGANSALVVAPYYNKPPQDGLLHHFLAVADSSPIPIILYNVPGRSVANIEVDTYLKLSEHENIVGVKEASGNIGFISEVMGKIKKQRPDFLFFSGDDNLTLPILALGGHGVISVASNIIPEKIIEMTSLALKNDMAPARSLFFEILPLLQALFIKTNPIPLKKAMSLLDMPSGPLRPPLIELSESDSQLLKQVIEEVLKSEIVSV